MKNNKFTKITLAILAFALCIGAAFAMTINAAEDSGPSVPAPKIISQNVEYGDQYKLMYAVAAEDITTDVTLRVYDHEPAEGSQPVYEGTLKYGETETISAGGVNKTVYKFKTQAISQLNMLDVFYVQAEANGQTSAVKTYSIAEYLYQRLSDPTATETQQNFYKTTIAYGDGLTTVCHKSTDPALTDADFIKNYRYVQVEGGTVNGKATGLYLIGTEVSPKAEGVASWNAILYGIGGAGNTILNEEGIEKLVIPDTADIVGIKFTTAKIIKIEYPTGYWSFDEWDSIQQMGASYTSGKNVIDVRDGATVTLVQYDDKRGQVLKIDNATNTNANSNAGTNLYFPTDRMISNADIAEISFDFYVEEPGTSTSGADQLAFKIGISGEKFLYELGIGYQSKTTGATDSVYINDARAYGAFQKIEGVETSGWVHVRVWVERGSSTINVCFNSDPEKTATIDLSAANSYTGDLVDYITRSGIMCSAYGNDSVILIDNLYIGKYNLPTE